MRTYEGVIDSIRHMLLTGESRSGDRLPSERDLADTLGVSRPMVREALRTLEVLGVVAARRGQGPAAGTFILTEPSPALATLLDMEFTLERFDLADVIDTRVMLERWAITGMPADADLSPAAHALTMMGEPLDREALMEWDLTFHQAIVDCASNRLGRAPVSVAARGDASTARRQSRRGRCAILDDVLASGDARTPDDLCGLGLR